MRLRFELVSDAGTEHRLRPGRYTLGSGADADLVLRGAGLEPVHLVLTVSGDRIFCQSRQPELGFTVNGRATTGDVLRAGDVLRVAGLALRVRGEVDQAAAENLALPDVVRTREEQVTLEDHYNRAREASSAHPLSRSFDVMYRLAGLVTAVHDQGTFYSQLLELVLGTVNASRVFLVLFGPHGEIEVAAAQPAAEVDEAGPSATILGRVWLDGISLLSGDTRHDPRLASSASITAGAIRTAICAPIHRGDDVVGAIYADSHQPDRQPTLEQLTLLESIASFTSMALERARLYNALKQRELHTHLLVHDMKNPLYAIVAVLDMVGAQLQALPSAWTSHLGLIRRSAAQLDGFISDILSVAELEGSGLAARRAPHDLSCFFGQLGERWHAVLELADLSLRIEVPPALDFELDLGLFDRVVANLVDNAIQHAPAGTVVSLRAEVRDGALRVEVADQGPGVPEAARPRIFEKFARAEAKNVSGRGLGLYFCRLAVEAHGGRVWVEGQPGCNRFVITLPSRGLRG